MRLTQLYGQSPLNKLSKIGLCIRPEEIGEPPTHSGSGLDDCKIGGFYDGGFDAQYKVTIASAGTPDTVDIEAKYGSSPWTTLQSGIAITGALQLIENDMYFKFDATTGHTAGDSWTVNCYANSRFNAATNFYCVDATKPTRKRRNVLTNEARANGLRGKSQTITEGKITTFPLSHPAVDVDLLAIWIYMALGKISDHTGSYTIVPTPNLRLPRFGIAWQGGDSIVQSHFMGNHLENLTINAPSDGFVSATASMIGNGYVADDARVLETTLAENATSIGTMDDIYGSTEADRMKSIHKILLDINDDGTYSQELTFTGSPTIGTVTIEPYSSSTTTHAAKMVYRSADYVLSEFTLTPKSPETPLVLESVEIGDLVAPCEISGVTIQIANTLEPRVCGSLASGELGWIDKFYLVDQKITISVTRDLMHWALQALSWSQNYTSVPHGFVKSPLVIKLGTDHRSSTKITFNFPLVDFLTPEVGDDGQILNETINLEPVYQSGVDVVTVTAYSTLDGIGGL